MATAVTAVAVAAGVAAGAQWRWNAALAANPIGLGVLAIAGLVAGLVILADDPAADDAGEQVLEGGTVILRVAQDFQCAWLIRQHGRQQAADHCLGIEFVEGWVDFQFRRAHAGRYAALQG